jgi:UDP-glucuronate decarboxylase
MTDILITGGAGHIGSAMAAALTKNEQYRIVVVDNLSTGAVTKIPKHPRVIFIKADINLYNDIVPIFGRFKFKYVFHYAAVVGVERTLEHPIKVLEDIEGIKNILSLSKNTGVKRVFYSSSSEVYGEPFEIPQNEQTTPLNSRLPYAIVKNVGEAFFRAYEREYHLNYTIFRLFNTYGTKQSDDFVLPRFVRLASKNQPIPIYGDGNQTRSFCHIQDHTDTCITAMEQGLCINDVLNVGNDVEISILDLAKKVIAISGSKSEIIHLPALKEGDMTRRCPDISKMKGILNRPLISLDEGIAEMVGYYQSR